MKIWNIAPEELKFNIEASLKNCSKNWLFFCLWKFEIWF